MKLSYGLYMAEQEGYLNKSNEREEIINNIIKDIKRYPDETLPNLVFLSICHQNGISHSSLTETELEKIKEKVKEN